MIWVHKDNEDLIEDWRPMAPRKRHETIKTVAGLIIIGLITIATFMYGNAQRAVQIKIEKQPDQGCERYAGWGIADVPARCAKYFGLNQPIN